jgi:hypothetical protein
MRVILVYASEDAKEYFSNNQPFDIRNNLGKIIQFLGYWMVAIEKVTVTE